MALRDSLGDGFERHRDVVELAWFQRLGEFMAAPVREVEDAEGYHRRSAVRRHVADAHRRQRLLAVAGDPQPREAVADDMERRLEGCSVEAERTGVILALIGRTFSRDAALAIGAPFLRFHAGGLWRMHAEALAPGARLALYQASAGQVHRLGLDLARRPVLEAEPAALAFQEVRHRLGVVHQVEPDVGVLLDSSGDPLQPLVPPSLAFAQKVD